MLRGRLGEDCDQDTDNHAQLKTQPVHVRTPCFALELLHALDEFHDINSTVAVAVEHGEEMLGIFEVDPKSMNKLDHLQPVQGIAKLLGRDSAISIVVDGLQELQEMRRNSLSRQGLLFNDDGPVSLGHLDGTVYENSCDDIHRKDSEAEEDNYQPEIHSASLRHWLRNLAPA
eukprot:CAMPEP_0115518792 /NCGR_PEP_ID=MMETSP0271-20121206/78082_1 /TAXON_ID=71861 /ORGANISM="Scrippsiella trochoidea, Strain CCMP3099" /LENGTH=172 /DNA_ID=CAMNT_0002949741 /DNA_START=240 /DNA_END=754 /DNA_ORIENTATION=-